MVKILLAPDKFKGTFTAKEVCAIITQGLRSVLPDLDIESCPIADGGDGFAAVLCHAMKGSWVLCSAHDANGGDITARYALCGDTAVLEMSEASGLNLIAENQRDVWNASTYGTGEMMRHAIEHSRVRRIIMGIGGSATNDAGCGMAAALGVRFLDVAGNVLNATPDQLRKCRSVETSARIQLPQVLVACDVDNVLLGETGATRVYGPQKGTAERDVAPMEEWLAQIVKMTSGEAEAATPGAGAAGGLGFGLMKFCGADLTSGFDLIAEETDLLEKIKAADVVITGEGTLDAQTLHGKGPAGVAAMARGEGKKVIAIAGVVETAPLHLFDCAYALHNDTRSLDETIRRSNELLESCAIDLANAYREHGHFCQPPG